MRGGTKIDFSTTDLEERKDKDPNTHKHILDKDFNALLAGSLYQK